MDFLSMERKNTGGTAVGSRNTELSPFRPLFKSIPGESLLKLVTVSSTFLCENNWLGSLVCLVNFIMN